MAKPTEMCQCQKVNCDCLYGPDRGDRKGKTPKGTSLEELPGAWCCPACGAGNKMCRPCAGPGSTKAEAV